MSNSETREGAKKTEGKFHKARVTLGAKESYYTCERESTQVAPLVTKKKLPLYIPVVSACSNLLVESSVSARAAARRQEP